MGSTRNVLVSGASIAGPALAYWLRHNGFAVTVVEQAGSVRGGGYPIDVRGSAVEIARRTGILDDLRKAHIDTRGITFLDGDGAVVTRLNPQALARGVEGRDIEVPRGELTEVLYARARDDVEFVFGDSIARLDEHADGVAVTFRSGTRRAFDLVVGADGLHSNVRGLVFGPEEQFHRYLGYCFAGFTMPNYLGLAHEGIIWNVPGRAAALYAAGDGDTVHGFLSFTRAEPPFHAHRDPAAQRELVATAFAGYGWQIPRMVEVLREADDLYFDVVSQIRMPAWSRGRVALVGEAAHAPSFLTGQGTSLALAGAYLLADTLAAHPDDHVTAFAAYERDLRPFVEANQGLVREGDATLFPATAEALARRNAMLRDLTIIPPDRRPEHSALVLPDPRAAAHPTNQPA